MRLLNWNLQWRTTRSAQAATIRSVLERDDLDVVCLTETRTDWLVPEGEWIGAEGDYGYGVQHSRRKVAMWARDGFSSVTNVSPEGMPPGRFVSGVTKSGVRVVGVCIPWRDAHVSTGRRDRKRWDEHREYLAALGRYLKSVSEAGKLVADDGRLDDLSAGRRPADLPAGRRRYEGRRRDEGLRRDGSGICVVGDFNQTLPRTRAPMRVYEAMMEAFDGLAILTTGRVVDAPMKLLDHVAVSPGGRLESWEQLPIVSDHVGWVADVQCG